MDAIGERLAEVRSRIGTDVTVVAVTKGFGPEAVRMALDAGLVDVGENYAQELLAKAAAVDAAAAGDVRWHFLGHVQGNKVKSLAPVVAVWQGVDGSATAEAITARRPDAALFVQVNLSGLAQRNGCSWEDAPAVVESAPGVRGLMGVAGPGDPRPQFRRLAALARELGLPEVSMGMSGDYAVAVEEGSTMVRLGTVLFGPRPERGDLRR
ncbi:MAG: dependent protein [Acidimicrobiaceae bacterium]|nr:dependent protein [Acidimicrobiaceae bacterium]